MSSLNAPEAKEDPLVQKMAEIGSREWQRYQTDFAPKEKQFIDSTSEIGSNREQDFIAGMSSAERQQQKGALEPTNRLAPLIGRSLEKTQLPEKNLLLSKARKAKGIETAISLGRDIGTASLGRIGRQAQISTSKNIATAESKGREIAGKADAAGTIAGVGLYKAFNKED